MEIVKDTHTPTDPVMAASVAPIKAESPTPIPEDLQNSINAVVALENCFHLLSEAALPYTRAKLVEGTLLFIRSLHSSQLEAVKSHPSYDLVKDQFSAPEVTQ